MEFIDTLTKDTDFLRNHRLMDYSLLVGVHQRKRAKQEEGDHYRERKEYMRVRMLDFGEDVMYIGHHLLCNYLIEHGGRGRILEFYLMGCYVIETGIIDILQPYTCGKAAETFVFGSLTRTDISCQHPDYYADRFIHFLSSQCYYDHSEERLMRASQVYYVIT